MGNPLFGGSGAPAGPQMQGGMFYIKQMMDAMKTARNPQSVLEHMAEQNPALQQVMQMCNGKNPQEIFYGMCQQQGVNPDDILSMLK